MDNNQGESCEYGTTPTPNNNTPVDSSSQSLNNTYSPQNTYDQSTSANSSFNTTANPYEAAYQQNDMNSNQMQNPYQMNSMNLDSSNSTNSGDYSYQNNSTPIYNNNSPYQENMNSMYTNTNSYQGQSTLNYSNETTVLGENNESSNMDTTYFNMDTTSGNETTVLDNMNSTPNDGGAYPPYYAGGNNPINSPYEDMSQIPTPQKKHPRWIYALCAIPVVILLLVVAVFTIPSLKSKVYATFMSPATYYKYVEEYSDDLLTNDASELFNGLFAQAEKKEFSSSSTIALNLNEALTSQLQGINLKALTLDMKATKKGTLSQSTIHLNGDGKSILTAIATFDTESQKCYLQIPEINTGYIDLTNYLQSAASSYSLSAEQTFQLCSVSAKNAISSIDPEKAITILERYFKSLYNHATEYAQVTKTKNIERKAGNLSGTFTKLELKLDQKAMKSCLTDLINEAKSDKELKQLVTSTGLITDSQYDNSMKTMQDSLKEKTSSSENKDDYIALNAYVNSNSKIIGREIVAHSDKTNTSLQYNYITLDNKAGLSFIIVDDNNKKITLSMNSTKTDDSYSGKFTFTSSEEEMPFDISFEKLSFPKNTFGGINGKVTFNINAEGQTGSVVMDFKSQKDTLTSNISINAMGIDFGGISIVSKEEKVEEISLPSGNDKIYDFSDETAITAFQSESDFTTFIQTLSQYIDMNSLASLLPNANTMVPDTPLNPDPNATTDPSATADPNATDPNSNPSAYNPADYGLPEGTTIDEYGYFSYEVNVDTAKAEGLPGNAYPLYATKYSDVKDTLSSLTTMICGNNIDTQEPYLTNKLYGQIESDGTLTKSTSYITDYSWYNGDSYDSRLTVKADTVTDQLISIDITVIGKDNAMACTNQVFNIVGNQLTDVDNQNLTAAFEVSLNDYKDATLGNSCISVSLNENEEYYISITPKES